MNETERWEVRLGKIRVGACGCQNCIPSQELLEFIYSLLKEKKKICPHCKSYLLGLEEIENGVCNSCILEAKDSHAE